MSAGQPSRRVVFFSGQPQSIGHIYRVEHTVAALRSNGWMSEWAPLSDTEAFGKIEAADLAVVFRAGLDANFTQIRGRCSDLGIPLVYDIDDLIFDPGMAAGSAIALLDGLTEAARLRWMDRIESYRSALAASSHAIVTTKPLAEAAGRFCKSVSVLPNVLGPEMLAWAAAASENSKPSSTDGRLRLIFASGTPTHQRDFQVAAEAVARLFARHPAPLLTILGELDLTGFPVLAPYAHRIEVRPRTPLSCLFAELARADINLCPLELENLFCEAKSAVRCLAASAVGVPSVVSPTLPLREAVSHGAAGLVAGRAFEWESALERYIDDSGFRNETGRNARAVALEFSDFSRWSSQACSTYQKILARE